MASESSMRIEDFLEEIRSSSFPVSTQQLIAAHELLVQLQARNAWPGDVRRFASLLAPVLCSSPTEQEEFYHRFAKWFSGPEPEWNQNLQSKPGSGSEQSPEESYLVRPMHVLIVCALILVLAVGRQLWIKHS